MKEKTITAGLLALLVILGVSSSAIAEVSTPILTETFLNQDPDPAEPGKYVELRWKVEKVGNAKLEDIEYVLKVDYPFSFDESDTPERNLGNWKGFSPDDEFHTLFYKVLVDDDAIEDTYEIELRSTTGSSDIWVINKYEVRVGDKERPEFILGQLSTSPIKLASDLEEAELNVEIDNIGDGDAENVVVEIGYPEGFIPAYSYSDRDALGTIQAGASKTATFYVDIGKEVAGGIHEAMLRITYRESGDDELKSKLIQLDLPLKDKPMFEIESVQTIPEEIRSGDTVELRLNVKNIGGEEAESVSVRAFKDASQPLDLFEKSDFIGKLRPGETGEAVLRLTVDSDAVNKKYLLDIEIRAVDGEEVIVQDRTIALQVGGGNQTASNGFSGAVIGDLSPTTLVAFVVVIVVVGSGTYVLGKRKASKKKKKA